MRMRVDEFAAPVKIFRMVGAEVQARSRVSARGEAVEHFRLNEPVFVVAFFRPRIREKEKDFRKAATFGQGEEKFRRFRFEKCEIGQPGEFAFAVGAFDTFRNEVEPEAELLRERLRVSGEKMPVPATDFERESARSRNDIGGKRFQKFCAELGNAFRALFHGKFVIGHNKNRY